MKGSRLIVLATAVSSALPLIGQNQVSYTGADATGQVGFYRSVNLQQVQDLQAFSATNVLELQPKAPPKRLHPPVAATFSLLSVPAMHSLSVVATPFTSGFNGLTHLDQRLANWGNQFSVEPPNPAVAAGNGYVLEGVNNAIQVYTTAGTPLLHKVISTNELFGVPAAIDRSTGINGVFPTDMRVFFDAPTSRWFVLQRSQDNDTFGNPVGRSHIYIAVSQTPDPTGVYNIYSIETTNGLHAGCPCVSDYPQIGADQYGFYISTNEFNTYSESFVDVSILAISKAALATGAVSPAAYKFLIPFSTGYEFAIQPATTPPGASYFLASGGAEFFVSTIGSSSAGDNAAIWVMLNTSSLSTGHPNPTLTRILVPTLPYYYPDAASQPAGSRPYGLSLNPPGPLPFIDGGDIRTLSLSYSGARLYMTLSTKVSDEASRSLIGGAYMVFSPSVRGTVLSAPLFRQGYLVASNNHLLRPSIAVDAQGRGAIAATLVGPDWFPSAAFIPFDIAATPSILRIATAGSLPEDGFTGYSGGFAPAIARWGDYSSAFVASDGSVWMVAEYIGSSPRTPFANWDTFIMSTKP